MLKFYRLAYYWLPPLLWMVVIFYLSSRSSTAVTGRFVFDFLIFKTLHMIEYAILYFLLFRSFYHSASKKLSINQRFALPLFISLAYAVSDEIHQTFVPTREGRLRDILIDAAGISLMYIYIKTHISFVKKLL